MRDLQANFGGFDIAVDDNDEEEEDLENENYGNEDDDYVRVESNDVTEQKKYRRPQDEKPDYEEIDNTPPNFGYGQGNQDADNNSADKIEDQDQEGQDQEELVVEEGDPYPHKVEKEFVLLNDTVNSRKSQL